MNSLLKLSRGRISKYVFATLPSNQTAQLPLLRGMTTTTATTPSRHESSIRSTTAVTATTMHHWDRFSSLKRSFSSAATTIESTTTTSPDATTTQKNDNSSSSNSNKKNSSSTGNVFLDYMGTIFLSAIGLLIAWLVRGYYNSKYRNLLRDTIENQSHLDPLEIDDLRTANSELTVQDFRTIQEHVYASAALLSSRDDNNKNDADVEHLAEIQTTTRNYRLTYEQFVTLVRQAMVRMKGEAYTVQLGHLLDRIATAAMDKQNKSILKDTMPITFWLTLLTLALNSTSTERMQVLFDILRLQRSNEKMDHLDYQDTNNDGDDFVPLEDVVTMVQYLQDTCQLAPDAQIVNSTQKYPLQEYMVGTGAILVDRQQFDAEEKILDRNRIDVHTFADVLCSKSVCAWGECYHTSKRRK